jgi:anti-sigma B factor antagonist
MTQIESPLHLQVEHDGAVTTVRLSGELDAATAGYLRDCLAEVYLQGERRVLLDLGELDFMDSTGIGVLVAALKRQRQDGGELALRSPKGTVRKVLELTQLDSVFIIS